MIRPFSPRIRHYVVPLRLDTLLKEGFEHGAQHCMSVVLVVHLLPVIEEGSLSKDIVAFHIHVVEIS